MEEWKDIPGYEGLYQASNEGQIRSTPGKITHSARFPSRVWRSRILKPKACKDQRKTGYRVSLWKDGKSKDYLIARLVCTTWHENMIDSDMTVNHIDGNRLNNRIENLEWLTLRENVRHAFENGLQDQTEVILTQEYTGKHYKFRSEAEASRFLGRSNRYVSCAYKRGYKVLHGADGRNYFYSLKRCRSKIRGCLT